MPSHRPRSGSPTTSAARRRRRRCEPRIAALPGVGRSRRCSTWPPSWSEAWHCGMSGSTRQFGRPQPQLRSLPADWPVWLGETKGDVGALPRPGAGRRAACVWPVNKKVGKSPCERSPPYPKTWRFPGMGRRDPIAPFVHQMAKKHDSRGEDKRRGSVPDVSLETYLPLACYS
jgi:hypothetical protein